MVSASERNKAGRPGWAAGFNRPLTRVHDKHKDVPNLPITCKPNEERLPDSPMSTHTVSRDVQLPSWEI